LLRLRARAPRHPGLVFELATADRSWLRERRRRNDSRHCGLIGDTAPHGNESNPASAAHWVPEPNSVGAASPLRLPGSPEGAFHPLADGWVVQRIVVAFRAYVELVAFDAKRGDPVSRRLVEGIRILVEVKSPRLASAFLVIEYRLCRRRHNLYSITTNQEAI